MLIDTFHTMDHYRAHLEPIWEACGAEGTHWTVGGDGGTEPLPNRWPDPDRPVLVASYVDALKVQGRRIVHVEHGAGQSYDLGEFAHPSYSGGEGMPDVALFLTPNEAAAQRWRDAYPDTPAVAVGCPRLDRLHANTESNMRIPGCVPTVGFTFHWDANLCPESRSALEHYDPWLADIIRDLRARGCRVVGHEHPKWHGRLNARWSELGVETVTLDQLLTVDVLVADNTSVQFEAASMGVPNVVLNAPWYRRDVEHGFRYWSMIPGITCDEPGEVVDAVRLALEDPPEVRAHRDWVVRNVYAYTDGRCAERAADAIRAYACPVA